MNARDVILSRLRRRKPETALEREFYCSPEEYQVDLEMIWYRDWLFVGHDCEVPKAGDYMTGQIGVYPVVVVRDRTGGLNVFHNSVGDRESVPPRRVRPPDWCVRIINGPIISTGACSRRATWARDSIARNMGCTACIARASAGISGCASPRPRPISSPSASIWSRTSSRTRCMRPRSRLN